LAFIFSTADLMAVRRIAVPGPMGQIIIATAVGTSMAALWGFSCGAWQQDRMRKEIAALDENRLINRVSKGE
jgi:hypothetical protein